ncbi:MAG: hypothetical protein AAF652_20530 [Cyanobacteria bacterium P01_C01_bin.72]
MNKKIYFLAASLIFSSATQLITFMPEAFAQVEDQSNSRFSINQRMKIDDQFKLLELKVSQQQKDAWSNDLFGQDNSITMKLNNLQTIRLSEEELKNSGSNDGLEVISF